MANYSGMTWKQILERAEIIAQENGYDLDRLKSANFINEAMLAVGRDILEFTTTDSRAWPSGSPPSINVKTEGWLEIDTVYGDETPLVYIPYERYREMFIGTSSLKASGDFNYYWSRLGDVIYLEPNVTEFTNLVIEISPLFAEYEQDGSIDDTEPALPFQYRILVCYKIPELIYNGPFTALYKKELRDKRTQKNRKVAKGQVSWWDPFAGTESYRSGASWPGKISNN